MIFPFVDENGGDGGSRTRVHDSSKVKSFTSLFDLLSQINKDRRL